MSLLLMSGTETFDKIGRILQNVENIVLRVDSMIIQKEADKDKLREQDAKIRKEIIELREMKKDLSKFTKDFIKIKSRKNNVIGGSVRELSGFASDKPLFLSTQLCEFLKVPLGTNMSRKQVETSIRTFIKTEGLQNPSSKRNIIINHNLEKLFGNSTHRIEIMKQAKLKNPKLKSPINDEIGYFNIQTHLKVHFSHNPFTINDVHSNSMM
jgi:chromatin remodeling complex protein RSC6